MQELQGFSLNKCYNIILKQTNKLKGGAQSCHLQNCKNSSKKTADLL